MALNGWRPISKYYILICTAYVAKGQIPVVQYCFLLISNLSFVLEMLTAVSLYLREGAMVWVVLSHLSDFSFLAVHHSTNTTVKQKYPFCRLMYSIVLLIGHQCDILTGSEDTRRPQTRQPFPADNLLTGVRHHEWHNESSSVAFPSNFTIVWRSVCSPRGVAMRCIMSPVALEKKLPKVWKKLHCWSHQGLPRLGLENF